MQKYVHLVDLVKSFPTSIYLQKSASIQPRTSVSKFGGKLNSLFIRLLSLNWREVFVDLWSVFTLQGRHKQAVVAIRQAVELVASGSSDWGLYVRIEACDFLDLHLIERENELFFSAPTALSPRAALYDDRLKFKFGRVSKSYDRNNSERPEARPEA